MISSHVHIIKTLPRLERVDSRKCVIAQPPVSLRHGGRSFLVGFPDRLQRDHVRNRLDLARPQVVARERRPRSARERMEAYLRDAGCPASVVPEVSGLRMDNECAIVFRKAAPERRLERLISSYAYHINVIHDVTDFGRYDEHVDVATFVRLFLRGAYGGLALPIRITAEDEHDMTFLGQLIYPEDSDEAHAARAKEMFNGGDDDIIM